MTSRQVRLGRVENSLRLLLSKYIAEYFSCELIRYFLDKKYNVLIFHNKNLYFVHESFASESLSSQEIFALINTYNYTNTWGIPKFYSFYIDRSNDLFWLCLDKLALELQALKKKFVVFNLENIIPTFDQIKGSDVVLHEITDEVDLLFFILNIYGCNCYEKNILQLDIAYWMHRFTSLFKADNINFMIADHTTYFFSVPEHSSYYNTDHDIVNESILHEFGVGNYLSRMSFMGINKHVTKNGNKYAVVKNGCNLKIKSEDVQSCFNCLYAYLQRKANLSDEDLVGLIDGFKSYYYLHKQSTTHQTN